MFSAPSQPVSVSACSTSMKCHSCATSMPMLCHRPLMELANYFKISCDGTDGQMGNQPAVVFAGVAATRLTLFRRFRATPFTTVRDPERDTSLPEQRSRHFAVRAFLSRLSHRDNRPTIASSSVVPAGTGHGCTRHAPCFALREPVDVRSRPAEIRSHLESCSPCS